MSEINALPILARQIAGDIGVTIDFVMNATPHVNLLEKRIVLPTNVAIDYMDTLIGMTFHEASHVAYTDNGIKNDIYINVLEDIRIDNIIFKKYPAAKSTYFHRLFADAFSESCKNDEPHNVKILKQIIFKGEQFKFEYDDDPVRQFFSEHQPLLDEIINGAIQATSTSEIVPLSVRLRELFLSEEDKNKRDNLDQCQSELVESAKRLEEESNEQNKKKNQSYQQQRKAQQALEKRESSQGNSQDDNLEMLKKNLNEAKANHKENVKIHRGIRNELKRTQNKVIFMEREKNQLYYPNGLSKLGGLLMGFEALPNLAYTAEPLTIEISTKDALKSLFENQCSAIIKEGNHLNQKGLAYLYTNPEKIFVGQSYVPQIKGKLVFLLDASGSMDWEAAGIVRTSVSEIALALDEIQADMAPEFAFAIYGFNDDAFCLKNFEQKTITWDRYCPSGGTEIARALKSINRDLNMIEANDEKLTILCLTDGEIQQADFDFVTKQLHYATIFLGILVGPTAHPFFHRYAIKNLREVNKVLVRAIGDSIV